MVAKKHARILLKLSGESLGALREPSSFAKALADGQGDNIGVAAKAVQKLARELAQVNKGGVALAIVIGGGNIWRFRDNQNLKSLSRESSDYLGMLATVFNAVVLQAELKRLKCRVEVFSAASVTKQLAQKYTSAVAIRILKKGGIVLLAGGTGKPYVTTDTAAAMRAAELKCERVLKATNVAGVYSADPRKNKKAKFFKELDYSMAIKKELGVMDTKAFWLLKRAGIPLTVFNFNKKGLLLKAVSGYNVGTLIS